MKRPIKKFIHKRSFLMLFLVGCALSLSTGEVMSRSTSVFERMKNGEKFSTIMKEAHPSLRLLERYEEATDIIEFLDSIDLSNECWTKAIESLTTDCEDATIDDRRHVAIKFTKCYYEVSGRKHEFPSISVGVMDSYDRDQMIIEAMQDRFRDTYPVFKAMELRFESLCSFTKQCLFNQVTAENLVHLFESVMNSTHAVDMFSDILRSTSEDIDKTTSSLHAKVLERDQQLSSIEKRFSKIANGLEQSLALILNPFKHIENAKRILLVIVISCVVLFFAPSLLAPFLFVTILTSIVDSFLNKHLKLWDGSTGRAFLMLLGGVIMITFPVVKYRRRTEEKKLNERPIVIPSVTRRPHKKGVRAY